MEASKSMPLIDFSRTVFVRLEPGVNSESHTQPRDGRTLQTKGRRHFLSGVDSPQLGDWPGPS